MSEITSSLRKQVIAEIATCHWCGFQGERREFDADHLIPLSKGGETALYNLVPACAKCNRARGNRAASSSNDWASRSRWSRASSEERFTDLAESMRIARQALDA